MHLSPMARDVTTTAEPDALKASHVVEKFYQTGGTRRTTDQAVMQANRHQPGMLCTFLIQQVKGIPHVLQEVIGVCEAVALITAIVIGLVGVGDNQMRLTPNRDPVGEFVVKCVAV